jgi:hypothetical protein
MRLDSISMNQFKTMSDIDQINAAEKLHGWPKVRKPDFYDISQVNDEAR